MSSITDAPTLHSLRLAVVSCIASNYLRTNGGISLGHFLDSFRDPVVGESIAGENGCLFKYIEKKEVDALYEPLLNFLNLKHGPLVCDAPGEAGPRMWGYAGEFGDGNGGGIEATSDIVELWIRRTEALDEGHPDQRYWLKGRAPYTFWRPAVAVKNSKAPTLH
ncbi:hypothetical protein J2X06_001708 [Lysobacter niastensis]|uniref:Uncharacterized protein n=1 Tax=Lysobacter niastensis TaxID=380629 RepID=A0ABU1WAE1_9GAMM|nr:hypothetical protein [Lysobacter niastensis]MDR7134524.1 hypothetical protein [Lysobacter niastensis]